LKGLSLYPYKSPAKTIAASLDSITFGTTLEYGARFKAYDEVTGVLFLDAGYRASATTSSGFDASDNTAPGSVYIVINASKSPALVGVSAGRLAARATNTNGQSIPNGSTTKITWNNSTFGRSGLSIDTVNSRYNITKPGVYAVSARIQYNSAGWGAPVNHFMYIYVNGSLYSTIFHHATENNSTFIKSGHASDLVLLNAGDYVEIYVNQASGAAKTLNTGSNINFFNISFVSE
jgi:hypothetical protein